jgi:hypothetical protein
MFRSVSLFRKLRLARDKNTNPTTMNRKMPKRS